MRTLLIIVLIATAIGCSDELSAPQKATSDDYFPLASGNRWVYARELYFRGTIISKDTLTVTVMPYDSSRLAWGIIRSSTTRLDTLFVKRVSRSEYDYVSTLNPMPTPLLRLSMTPVLSFLPTKTDITGATETNSFLSDSVFDSHHTTRVLQHFRLFNRDTTATLPLEFEQAFVPGIGQVSARFVSDINQCLACSLPSEFYTSTLIDYTIY